MSWLSRLLALFYGMKNVLGRNLTDMFILWSRDQIIWKYSLIDKKSQQKITKTIEITLVAGNWDIPRLLTTKKLLHYSRPFQAEKGIVQVPSRN